MIKALENGWEQYEILICRECRALLYQPGSADLALFLLVNGSCGHPYPGYA